MFERTEIAESIYEGVVEPSYKELIIQIPILIASTGRLEKNPPGQILTSR